LLINLAKEFLICCLGTRTKKQGNGAKRIYIYKNLYFKEIKHDTLFDRF